MYQRFLKTSRLLTLAIGVSASLMGVTTAQAAEIKWAAQNDILTLDPHSQNHATTNNIVGHTYEGLVRYDKNYKIEPSLATSWSNVNPTTVRFNLRKGVKSMTARPSPPTTFCSHSTAFVSHKAPWASMWAV